MIHLKLDSTHCLPQFGVIVLTTANGILDHEEARRKKVGGKVLGRPSNACTVHLFENIPSCLFLQAFSTELTYRALG